MVNEKGKLGNAVYEFSESGDACVIYDPRTPRYWYNYLWNDHGYCAQISQTGHGRSYYLNEKADMCMLNGDGARHVYIRDEDSKESWNIGYGPLNVPLKGYSCTHAIGYSLLYSEKDRIKSSWQICVPQDLYGELWKITISNTSKCTRTISLFPAVSFSLDGFSYPRYYEMYRCLSTSFDSELGGIFCKSNHPFAPHRRYQGYLASSEAVHAYDGDLTAFLGACSTRTEKDASSSALYQRPEILLHGDDCTGSNGALFIPGAVLQHKIRLLPGEEKEIRLIFGVSESLEEARETAKAYLSAGRQEKELRCIQKANQEKYGTLSAKTPDGKINVLMNSWVKKQVDFCIVGKKGVRDNLQIAAALLDYRPEKAQKEILEVLRHQFRDGHAVLTWYPYDDTRYSDQPFWIIWAVSRLIRETGDRSLLDVKVSWQDGGEPGTVLDHVKAAVTRLLMDRGRNGLVRIYFADWNDALNIPPEEEAESVMLSEQFALALKELRELSLWIEDADYAAFLEEAYISLKNSINIAAWDGEWYMRALAPSDNIGSRMSKGSKCYLNAQTWAVLAGVAEQDRLDVLLASVDAMERDFGFPLNDPPYLGYDPMAGRMSGMLPGLFENGGVYCHASAFKLLMDCELGRGAEALRTLKKIMPDSEWNPSAQSGAEPYVFTNCYATHPDYYGRSYQSWTTGTSAWCLRGLYEGIFGVNADFDGLRINPVFPPEWKEANMTRRFRGADYKICFHHQNAEKIRITVDGTGISGQVLPDYRDGKIHQVEVYF